MLNDHEIINFLNLIEYIKYLFLLAFQNIKINLKTVSLMIFLFHLLQLYLKIQNYQIISKKYLLFIQIRIMNYFIQTSLIKFLQLLN